MSNQVDHRKTDNKRNKRRKERLHNHGGCGGEGRNGAIGRAKWKKLSSRSERRAAGKKIPKVKKRRKTSHAVPDKDGALRTVTRTHVPKPVIDDDYDYGTYYDNFEDGMGW